MKLKIQARAKINWTLDVVGVLPNGYHDLDMLKRVRHIRNLLAHEPYLPDTWQSTERDVLWIEEFHQRILDRTDPLALLRAAQGYALVQGRDYVVPEDIKAVAVPVLAHRFICEEDEYGRKAGRVQRLLQTVAVPTEDWKRA